MFEDALMLAPMKINKIPKGKENLFPSLCTNGEYFAQEKKDGSWYQFEKTKEHTYLFGHAVSAVTGYLTEKSANVPHIINRLNVLPAGTILIGEIYYPGKTVKDVVPIMGSLPDKAVDRQTNDYGWIHYYIHDIVYYNGVSLIQYGASIRYKILSKVFEKFSLANEYIELAPRFDDNIQEEIAKILNEGGEGAVLKKKMAPYAVGKRPAWDTIKIKKTDTCDAVCLKFNEPTCFYNGKLDIGSNYSGSDAEQWDYWCIFRKNELNTLVFDRKVPIGDSWVAKAIDYVTMPVTKAYYYNWKTSMDVGAYDDQGNMVKIGSISSGLNEEIQANYQLYVGKVVELSGMEKNYEDHTLRHFYLKRFRDDKDAKDCLLKEIF